MRKEKRNENIEVGEILALGMTMLLTAGVALAQEPPSVSPTQATTKNGSNSSDLSGLIDEIRKRAEGQAGKNWKETADALLILERDQMAKVSQDSNELTRLGGPGHRKSDAIRKL